MPAFRCCKVTWKLADDDFVPSAFLSMIGIFFLFLWAAAIASYVLSIASDLCTHAPISVLVMYFSLELVYQLTNFIVALLTFLVSKSGSLQKNVTRMKWMEVLFIIRLFMYIPEVCLAVYGLILAWNVTAHDCDIYIHNLIAAYSMIISIAFVLKIISYLVVMDPCGCYTSGPVRYIKDAVVHQGGTRHDSFLTPLGAEKILGDARCESTKIITFQPKKKGSGTLSLSNALEGKPVKDAAVYNKHTAKLWQRRLRLLSSNTQHANAVAHDVAKVFSIMFEDNDLVPSDIMAAIILERREHKRLMNKGKCDLERLLRKKLISQMRDTNFLNGRVNYRYCPPQAFNCRNQAERNELDNIVYFFKYAKAVYGWPLVLFEKPIIGCCLLCKVSCGLFCAVGCSECSCHDAAFWHLSKLPISHENIILVSRKNELFYSPYVVMMDHRRQSIVIAIRGSLSPEDSLTCMSVHLTPMRTDEPELQGKENYVHGGWYQTAVNIYDDLKAANIFHRFDKHPTYRLVLVGHSLGGAVASILAVVLRFNHKASEFAQRLHCYCYSAPGCVFSYSLATYCKPFVTTIAIDNDIIPRLNWRSLLYFKKALVRHLTTSDKPKYQVLYTDKLTSCVPCCIKTSDEENDPDARGEQLWNRRPSKISRNPITVSAEYKDIYGHASGKIKSIPRSISLDCPNIGTHPHNNERKHSLPIYERTHRSRLQENEPHFILQAPKSTTRQTNELNHSLQPPASPTLQPQSLSNDITVQPIKDKRSKLSLLQTLNSTTSFETPGMLPLNLFIEEVYNSPDWNSLGHFAPLQKQVSVGGGIMAVMAASKWKAKALGVTSRRRTTGDFEKEARTLIKVPAFLPGKVLQITSQKEPLSCCPGQSTTRFALHWKANEDFCLIRLDGGSPLSSHMPSTIDSVLSAIKKTQQFSLDLFPGLQNESAKGNDLRDAEEGLCQSRPRIVREGKDQIRGDIGCTYHSPVPHQGEEQILEGNIRHLDLSHSLQRQSRIDEGDGDELEQERENQHTIQPDRQLDASETVDGPKIAYVEVHCPSYINKSCSSIV